MYTFIRTTLQPTAYHGHKQSPPFFEGWYFKLVDATAQYSWAVIPGIYKGVDPAHSQAFVMVLDGRTHAVTTHRFPVSAFRAATDAFLIQVGGNLFSAESVSLNLPTLSGHLRFHNVTSWPVTLRSPGIMGWYAWMPFMECYHGLVSLDHGIEGVLSAESDTVDMTGGRGYTEKDWGRSFPQTWIWTQANHFDQAGTSLTASVARIPWIGYDFPGFIIGLWHDGVLHRFTTYNRSQLERVALNGDQTEIVVFNRTHRLAITAQRGATGLLPAPTPDRGMVPRVNESLSATVAIQFSRRSGELIFASQSANAGLEIEGDTTILLTD
ncbi:MAG: tocopherol cyclase family protein [Anaerolineae bacterium]|nr:tocopherol cyclase family protein [Anaerolineae bacterium]